MTAAPAPLSSTKPLLAGTIQVKNLERYFEGTKALGEIRNLEIKADTITSLLGRSGCGKTTLLRCLAGLLRPTRGEVWLGGDTPEEARNRGTLSFAFQNSTLLPWLTLLDNVLLPFRLRNSHSSPDDDGQDAVAREARDRESAKQALELVGMLDQAAKRPYELSGGERQRVNLARALVTKPRYMFLDEPFGQLDPDSRDDLYLRLEEFCLMERCTVVMVTHAHDEAVLLSRTLVLLPASPGDILNTMEIVFASDQVGKPRNFRALRSDPTFSRYQYDLRRALRDSEAN